MSIEVQNVSKIYGEQRALNDVSFSIGKGEIVGFLGPNGAGKSTMMKIITCYIPQSEGKVAVCGFDVEGDPMSVRSKIGYLPEHNPQYLEMYIKEYLQFIGGIYKVKNLNARIDEMIELVGLQKEQHKKIGALSKGYRQRVGLAQALIHDPEVLILDEPTTGLDPNQIVEIRQLIQRLGKEKTVMMSTHIMQEVEAICDRVIIINNGQIVADKPTSQIQSVTEHAQLVIAKFKSKPDLEQLNKLKGVISVSETENNTFKIEGQLDSDLREDIFHFAVKNNHVIVEMYQETFHLEDVFQQLTK